MTPSPSVYIRDRGAHLGIDVSEASAELLATYFELLGRWNAKTNLTSLPLGELTPASVDRLLIEPIMGAQLLRKHPEGLWIDLGSGGGSPAIPMRIVLRNLNLVMIESKGKKAAFLREAVRALGFSEVEVRAERFEAVLLGHPRIAELITSRAVRLDENVLQVVTHALSPTGQFLSFGHQHGTTLKPLTEVARDAAGTVLFEPRS